MDNYKQESVARSISLSLLLIILLGIVIFSFNPFISRLEIFYLYDSKRLFAIVAVSLSLLLFAIFPYYQQYLYSSWHDHTSRYVKRLLVIFFSFTVAATLFAKYPLGAITQWSYYLGLIILVFVLKPIAYCERKRIWQYFTWISILLFLSVAAIFWIRIYNNVDVNIHTILSFTNPRFLNQVHTWTVIPVAYLTLLSLRTGKGYLLMRAILAINFSIVVATDARGSTLAITAAFVLMAIIDKYQRKVWWKLLWQSLLLGTLVSLIFLNPLPTYLFGGEITPPEIRTHDSGRIELWLEALSMSHFWGLGSEAFVCDSKIFGGPHNSVLDVLVHWGAGAALCYCLLVFKILTNVLTTGSRAVKVSGVTVLTGLMLSLVSGSFRMPLSQIMAALCFAMFWGAETKHRLYFHQRPPKMLRLMGILVAIVCITSISYRVVERIEDYPTTFTPDMKTQFWLGHNCLDAPEKP